MPRPRALPVGAALVVAGLVLAGCSGGDEADYDAAYEEDFQARCTEAYGRRAAAEVCGCWYDGLEAAVAFEDLPDLDDLVADDFDIAPTRMPGGELDVPLETLAACVRRLGAEPTLGEPVPPPTLPRPPTTPPTTTTVLL